MKLTESDILNILQGAAIMAGGGGGAVDDALLLLNAFKKKNPNKPVEIELIGVEEMDKKKKAAGIAVMGAPSGGSKLDITPCILNAFDALKQKSKQEGYELSYTLPLELGGFNTFVPILVSLYEDLPMIDADCCARAVPGLETTLSHIHHLPTGPLVMADVDNNYVTISSADPCDAEKIEELALPIVEQFSQNAGIAGWCYTSNQMKQALPLHTITTCKQIGEGKELQNCVDIAKKCRIIDFHTEQIGGWDVGTVLLQDITKKQYKITFSNENLLLQDMEFECVIASAPDCITLCDKQKKALTNEDLMFLHQAGNLFKQEVSIIVIKPSSYWYEQGIKAYWNRYFKLIGMKDTPKSMFK